MHIEFTRLTLENFKSFSGRHVLRLDKFEPGLHFIRGDNQLEPRIGSNGAGKSTVFDALCWCLYGKTPNGLRNPDVRPWNSKKTTTVSVTLFIGDDEYHIERTASPNSVSINGKEVGNESVEELLFSMPVCVNTVIMGQSQPLFFDLQPRDKMSLFVDVLQLDRWDERAQRASAEASNLNNSLLQLEGEITGIDVGLQEVVGLLDRANQQHKEWATERKKQLSELQQELDDCNESIEKLEPKVADCELAYDGASVELKSLQKQIDAAQENVRDADRALAQEEAAISSLEAQVRELERSLDELGDGSVCPVCGQSTKGTSLDKHRKELVSKKTDLEKKIKKGVSVRTRKLVDEVNQTLRSLKESQAAFIEKAEAAEAELNMRRPRLAELKTKRNSLNVQIDQLERQDNPHTDSVARLKQKRKSLQQELDDAHKDKAKLERQIERSKFWAKGFKDIRLYVVDEVLQELELVTNAMLEDVGLIGWEVSYSVEKETKKGSIQRGLNVSIISPTISTPVRWEAWSGGEGQRLRLVGALALSEVLLNHAGIETNLEILDEPTRHLSPEGIRDLIEFLADRARQLELLTFYVDHAAVESVLFSSVTTVVKDKKGSRLEWDSGSSSEPNPTAKGGRRKT